MLPFPGFAVTDTVPFLLECRRRGLVFVLADGALAAGPQHLIDPDLAAAIRTRKDALVAALRAEAAPPAPPLAWPTDRVPPRVRLRVAPEAPGELERLLAALDAAQWPAEPFLVNRAVLVADPALAKRALREAGERRPAGQVRAALLARCRKLRRLAGNGWKLTEG